MRSTYIHPVDAQAAVERGSHGAVRPAPAGRTVIRFRPTREQAIAQQAVRDVVRMTRAREQAIRAAVAAIAAFDASLDPIALTAVRYGYVAVRDGVDAAWLREQLRRRGRMLRVNADRLGLSLDAAFRQFWPNAPLEILREFGLTTGNDAA